MILVPEPGTNSVRLLTGLSSVSIIIIMNVNYSWCFHHKNKPFECTLRVHTFFRSKVDSVKCQTIQLKVDPQIGSHIEH